MTTIKIIGKFILVFAIIFLSNFTGYSQKQILPNRILSISGYRSGKIPLTILKQSKQIDIKSPYAFVSAEVYFGDTTGTRCVGTRPMSGNIFDGSILGALHTLDGRSLVSFDNIKVKDKAGQIFDVEDAFFYSDK